LYNDVEVAGTTVPRDDAPPNPDVQEAAKRITQKVAVRRKDDKNKYRCGVRIDAL
jgi:hypothetical protein